MNEVDGNLVAILGPTNTGKTYLAFDRMMAYQSGIFGFPLRLLARENYDKAVKKVGINKVALVTGEEKFIPKEAKYFFCTVESIPKNLNVECVIIDEIQLASDYERGHIFTDNLLHTRGEYETILLGSLTIKPLLLRMFPKIKESWVLEYHVWRTEYAQAVTEKNYSSYVPSTKTPYENTFICTMAQIYPEDRGTNYAIREGYKIANQIINNKNKY